MARRVLVATRLGDAVADGIRDGRQPDTRTYDALSDSPPTTTPMPTPTPTPRPAVPVLAEDARLLAAQLEAAERTSVTPTPNGAGRRSP